MTTCYLCGLFKAKKEAKEEQEKVEEDKPKNATTDEKSTNTNIDNIIQVNPVDKDTAVINEIKPETSNSLQQMVNELVAMADMSNEQLMGNKPKNEPTTDKPKLIKADGQQGRRGDTEVLKNQIDEHFDCFPSGTYTSLKQIGKGCFGTVYKVIRTEDSAMFACKMIDFRGYSRREMNGLVDEIEHLQKIDHPNVCGAVDIFQKEGIVTIIMPLCEGMDLFHHMAAQRKAGAQIDESTVASYIAQILEGLKYIHSKGIVHCDLKPSNIMFVDLEHNYLKITDFGLSQSRAEHSPLKMIQGTPLYMPPEVLTKEYGDTFDVWSVGIITFEMLYGYTPFAVKVHKGATKPHPLVVVKAAKRGFRNEERKGRGPWFNQSIKVSADVKDFIMAILVVDPAQRVSAKEALHHPWVNNEDHFPLDINVAEGMKQYSLLEDFQRAMIPLMVDRCKQMSEFLLKKVEKTFEKMSAGGNKDEIELEGFIQVMHDLGDDLSNTDYVAIFHAIDLDNKGSICMEEFITWYSWEYMNEQDERFWSLLKEFDEDGDGFIDLDELEKKFAADPRTAHYIDGPEMEAFHKLFEDSDKLDITKMCELMKNGYQKETSSDFELDKESKQIAKLEIGAKNLSNMFYREVTEDSPETAFNNLEDIEDN